VSLNFKFKPIGYGDDGYKTKEGLSKLLITREHPFVEFDAAKEIFNPMTQFIQFLFIMGGLKNCHFKN
jgi:hypothetical protein